MPIDAGDLIGVGRLLAPNYPCDRVRCPIASQFIEPPHAAQQIGVQRPATAPAGPDSIDSVPPCETKVNSTQLLLARPRRLLCGGLLDTRTDHLGELEALGPGNSYQRDLLAGC